MCKCFTLWLKICNVMEYIAHGNASHCYLTNVWLFCDLFDSYWNFPPSNLFAYIYEVIIAFRYKKLIFILLHDQDVTYSCSSYSKHMKYTSASILCAPYETFSDVVVLMLLYYVTNILTQRKFSWCHRILFSIRLHRDDMLMM